MRDESAEEIARQVKLDLDSFRDFREVLIAGCKGGYWNVTKTGEGIKIVNTAAGNMDQAEPLVRGFVKRGLAEPVISKDGGTERYAPTDKARQVVKLLES